MSQLLNETKINLEVKHHGLVVVSCLKFLCYIQGRKFVSAQFSRTSGPSRSSSRFLKWRNIWISALNQCLRNSAVQHVDRLSCEHWILIFRLVHLRQRKLCWRTKALEKLKLVKDHACFFSFMQASFFYLWSKAFQTVLLMYLMSSRAFYFEGFLWHVFV